MELVVTHSSGRIYRIPATQVICYTGSGLPLSVAYEHSGLVIQSDAQDQDFEHTLQMLKISPLEVSNG